jgi:hypothetical protein
MLRISYSKTSGTDVEGTREELQAVRYALLELARSNSGAWSEKADTGGNPHPFDAFLVELQVAIAYGPTRAHVNSSVLSITGNSECLKALASFCDVPEDATLGWHVHHEYYDGNRWVATDSEPLTVSLRRPTAA